MGITPALIATAAEALNRHPDLTPSARRVALELLNHLDRTTGTAWPSEGRMAAALGLTARTIRRAKVELAELGLLTWQRRGTSRKGRTPLYRLALDRLVSLGASIKARLKAARDRVRPPPKPSNDAPRAPVGRTFPSAYLTQCFKISTGGGFWKAPGTPQGQVLTDAQLDARASSRLWEALRRLAPAQLAQFLDHPDAARLQEEAVRAERYRPGTGLAVLAQLVSL